MLDRTNILACVPRNQPHGGDAHTADRRLRIVYYYSTRYTCNSAQETAIEAVVK